MKYYEEAPRKTKVLECDVLVAGAGTAGCVAAVAAARAGAKVVVVEKMPVPSGTLSNGGNGISSLYAQAQFPGDVRQIVRGLPQELVDRVTEWGGCDISRTPMGPHHSPVTPTFNHEVIKAVLCEIMIEAGVKVLLQTFMCGVDMEDGVIKAAFIENKSGRTAVVAKQYIDCTGDGDFGKYCGCEQTTNWQDYDKVCGAATSLPMAMAGIDFDRAVKEAPEIFRFFGDPKDLEAEEYKPRSYFLTVTKDSPGCDKIKALNMRHFISFGSKHPNEATNINNSKGVQNDCSTAEALSEAEMTMRIKNIKFFNALREEVPGFENSYITWQAMMLGIRSSRITICDHMITQEEISEGKRFDDEIGLYAFHDLASDQVRPDLFIKNQTGFYGFPYRMILPVGVKNLFMAGRCVTAQTEAHESTRNTVGCMIMGQGAGVAAALCAKKGCMSRELPYEELKKGLLAQNVQLQA